MPLEVSAFAAVLSSRCDTRHGARGYTVIAAVSDHCIGLVTAVAAVPWAVFAMLRRRGRAVFAAVLDLAAVSKRTQCLCCSFGSMYSPRRSMSLLKCAPMLLNHCNLRGAWYWACFGALFNQYIPHGANWSGRTVFAAVIMDLCIRRGPAPVFASACVCYGALR
jgi:hypothetical protein